MTDLEADQAAAKVVQISYSQAREVKRLALAELQVELERMQN